VLGQESAGFIEPLSNGGLRRVAGTLEHPNFLGSYLSLMMPILAVTAFASRFPTRLRVLAWFALLASIPLLLLTLSRGSWIGLGGGLLVLLIVLAVRGHISGSQATFGVLGMIAAAGAIVALPPVWDRLMSSNPYNVTFRLELIAVALPMWQAHFWNGVGLNLFVENMKAFDHNLVSLTKAPVHNIYFMWLAETGVIGAAGMAIYVIWLLARSWITTAARNHQLSLLATGFLAGMVALYLGELASFSTRIDVIAQTTALMAGIMVGLSRRGFLRRT
jgi:O-antigen ligase